MKSISISSKSQKIEIKNYIFQPNCFTEAHYNCTLLQERLINAIINGLQDAILKRMHGGNYTQSKLFEPVNQSTVYSGQTDPSFR